MRILGNWTVRVLLVLAFCHLVTLSPCHLVTAGEDGRIDRLINQLGSSTYADREEAGKALDEIGAPALEALRKAAQAKDAEIRRRSAALVRRIEGRVENAQLLAPHYVRLSYKDAPLADAVADLAKKTGFVITLAEGQVKAEGRTVTLDTGAVPFWEAFDRFCAAAGLAETTAKAAPAAAKGNTVVMGSVVVIGGGGVRTGPTDITKPETPDKPEPILLGDGKARELPAHYAGSLRVAAQPADVAVAGQTKGAGEYLLGLDVAAEPSLRFQRPLGLRIDKAIDDQGQVLKQQPVSFSKPQANRGNPSMIINGVPYYPDDPAADAVTRQVPVKLGQGDKPARALKELSGTLVGLVYAAPQTLAAVDDVNQATGKVVQGAGGSWLKVLEVAKQEDGTVKVRFLVETPPKAAEDNSAVPINMNVMINGRKVSNTGSDEPLSGQNFELADAKGKLFEMVKATDTGKRAGSARELEVVYQPADGQGEPAKFTYVGRRSAIVEVPFTLKDVPLP
jgi:hypothetical protein